MDEIEAAARDFLPAVEALCDWLSNADIAAGHAVAQPGDYVRLCEAMLRMQAALAPASIKPQPS